jgi:putative MATE family efflux protein
VTSNDNGQAQHREVLRLAVPAFLALIAEPLFLLADSAIVGHLGTAQLAGLGVASALLLTAANLFVFLAYGTTSAVARQVGSGSRRGAITVGLDGIWLALALGLVTAVLVAVLAEPLCRLFGASPEALGHAVTYLRISAAGIPGMLVVLATTGILRGLQDTRTPLVVAVAGFSANVVLNVLFVYGLHWGIGGSALGTVLAQTAMAAVLGGTVWRYAVAERVRVRAHPGRILVAARTGIPLFVRTLALRGVLVVTTWVAAGLGDVPLAAYQVSATIWSFLAFAVDAIAIAAQAITGKYLGAGDVARTREATRLMIRWGLWSGLVLALLVVAVHRVVPALFTGDPAVRDALAAGLLVVALMQPLAGVVFVIDGVLIGAGDNGWLAKAMTANLLLYLPLILAVHVLSPSGAVAAVVWLWVAFTGFMAIRGVLLGARVRTSRWMVVGATR